MGIYPFLLLLILVGTSQGQSVADAARAAQQRHQAAGTRQVITDDQMPAKPNAAASAGSASDAGMQAEIEHLRAVYLTICSDPEVRRSNKFSPEMKQQLEEAAQPLRKRLQENDTNTNSLESKKLSREEEAEVDALAPTDGRALTLEERQRIGAIRERYAEKRRALAGKNSESARQSLVVLGGVIEMISDCSKANSLQH
jgi:hypothetical protein